MSMTKQTPGAFLEDLQYFQKVLMWKSFGKTFNRNLIRPNSNVSGLLPETFVTF